MDENAQSPTVITLPHARLVALMTGYILKAGYSLVYCISLVVNQNANSFVSYPRPNLANFMQLT